MSRLLSELIEANEPFFAMAVHDLETASGSPGADIRLAVELIGAVQEGTRALGLDPADTNGQELYSALNAKFLHDNQLFVDTLGISVDADNTVLNRAFKKWLEAQKLSKSCWAVKKTAIKKLLKATPPPTVMKLLKYKSVDSMLKREHVGELLVGIKLLESEAWLHKFNASYKKLTAADFETTDVELLILDAERWEKSVRAYVASRGHSIAHVKELGVLAILPTEVKQPAQALTQLVFVLHYMQELRIYSSFFKHRQVHRKFGTLLSETLSHDPANAARLVGQDVHWRVVHRHFGTKQAAEHPSVFDPNVQPEDLTWQSTAAALEQLVPEMHFWNGLERAGVIQQGRPVSMNILDVARNTWRSVPYAQRTSLYLRLGLWHELLLRYLEHEVLEQQVLAQLDNSLPISETVAVSLLNERRV